MKSLQNHTVYPQIHIDSNNIFTVQLLSKNGDVKFEDIGAGKNYEDARNRAKNIVSEQIKKFSKSGEK